MNPEKKEVINEKDELLRKLILNKLSSIKKEKFEPKAIDKFSLTFRVFLLRHLDLNYEFTLEELINELNKRKISTKLKDRIIAIMNLLTEIEYEDRKVSKEKFKSLLSEAVRIVNLATGKAEEKEKTGRKEKEKTRLKRRLLSDFLHKIGLVKAEAEKRALKGKKEEIEKEVAYGLARLMGRILKCNDNINVWSYERLRKEYISLFKKYNVLSQKEKIIVYNALLKVYKKIKEKKKRGLKQRKLAVGKIKRKAKNLKKGSSEVLHSLV